MRKSYPNDKVSDKVVWAFSEITAVLIMEDPRFDHFWPSRVCREGYFSRSNYPQLASPEESLRAVYVNRKGFMDYMDKAVNILQKIDL
jgi:hypothetical protein